MPLSVAAQADDAPEHFAHGFLIEFCLAGQLTGSAHHSRLARRIERRLSGRVLAAADLTRQPHALGDTLDQLGIDTLDRLAQPRDLGGRVLPAHAVLTGTTSSGTPTGAASVRPAASANGRSRAISA